MSGNEGGDDLPTDNTTTETTEVPETERVTINELCQQLLADRSTDYDTRQLAASIIAHERPEPMGLIDFMGAIGLRALLHSRSNYGQDHTRRMLTRMAFNVQSFGRIAQSVGFQPPHACVRCGTNMAVGVTCGDCSHRLNAERQRRVT